MAEGILKLLSRKFSGAVLPPFQRSSLLSLLPSDMIGDQGVTTWAKSILKNLGTPKAREAGGDWMAAEDKFDITHIDIPLYDVQERVTMNRSERALFSRNGVLPVGTAEMGSKMADKTNKLLFLGPDSDDQFHKTTYQYVTAQNASSTSYSNPALATSASYGKWDAAGQVQLDAADLFGNLAKRGYSVPTSILFYPEVCEPIMRRPVVTGSSIYGDKNILQMFLDHGCMGAVSVKDTYLKTAAGSTPTVEAFDIYAVDLSQVIIGYTLPESTEVIQDPISKNIALDMQIIFSPLFKPRKYDTDGYIYKGVSRITACDANT